MQGSIYCGKCGKRVDEGNCPQHPRARFRVRVGGVMRRIRSREEAERFLNYARHMIDEATWTPEDYKRANPLLVDALVKEFLPLKGQTVSAHTLGCYDRWLTAAMRSWGARTNIKDIGYREIEKHVLALKGSGKTRANAKNGLHHFFSWVWKAYGRDRLQGVLMPDFPEVSFNLAFRDTLTKEEQQTVLDELHRQTWDRNPRIWLAVFLLATYPSIRPKELRGILEEDMLLEQGFIRIRDGKVEPKLIPILEEDAALIREIRDRAPRGLPALHFFRGCSRPFGHSLLYRCWKRACATVGIEGVCLYAGTKHTTVMALDEHFGEKEIQRSTGVSTNKAFQRYYGKKPDRLRKVYRRARPQTAPGTQVEHYSAPVQVTQALENKRFLGN